MREPHAPRIVGPFLRGPCRVNRPELCAPRSCAGSAGLRWRGWRSVCFCVSSGLTSWGSCAQTTKGPGCQSPLQPPEQSQGGIPYEGFFLSCRPYGRAAGHPQVSTLRPFSRPQFARSLHTMHKTEKMAPQLRAAGAAGKWEGRVCIPVFRSSESKNQRVWSVIFHTAPPVPGPGG